MSRTKKKDGLVSKVLKTPPSLINKDETGRYLPWCDYSFHRGIVKDEDVCKKRNCTHYKKLYL